MDVAMIATVTGVVGAICTLSIAFPQAYKVWRDRSSVGVSIVTWYLFCVYSFIWLGYSARVSNHLAFWTNFCTLRQASSSLPACGSSALDNCHR